jgi:hypothetical protein
MCLHHDAGRRAVPHEANRELVAIVRNVSTNVSPFLDARCMGYAQIWGYEKWQLKILQQRCPFDLLIGKFAVPVACISLGSPRRWLGPWQIPSQRSIAAISQDSCAKSRIVACSLDNMSTW